MAPYVWYRVMVLVNTTSLPHDGPEYALIIDAIISIAMSVYLAICSIAFFRLREESVKLFLVAVILKIIYFLYRATFTDWYEWSSSIGVYRGLPSIIIVIGIYWYSVSLAKKGIIQSKHAVQARQPSSSAAP